MRGDRPIGRLLLAASRLRGSLWGMLAILAISFASGSEAETGTRLGGDLTSDLPPPFALQVAAPNVTDPERRHIQASGFGPFHRIRSSEDGVGPLFVNRSCGECHVSNGRGTASLSSSPATHSRLVVKVKPESLTSGEGFMQLGDMGSQLADRSTDGRAPLTARLSWVYTEGMYPDGSRYQLRSPRISLSPGTVRTRRTVTSLRMAPPIVGPGLLEAVPWMTLVRLAYAEDARKDGISGRINWVPDARSGGMSVGRFGFKAAHPTVEQQTAAALYSDMGITSPLFNDADSPPEISQRELTELTLYQKLGGVPAALSQGSPRVAAGRASFFALGCELCHRVNLRTEKHIDPELSFQTIHPFSDLLLHYMGPGLADGVDESSASGGEWRTTPLWGLHLMDDRSVASVYLHDGRARTIEEAILWHGGEAARARVRFTRLPKSERDALIQFLRSL